MGRKTTIRTWLIKKFIIELVIYSALLCNSKSVYTADWEVTVLNNPGPGYIKMDWFNGDVFTLWDNYGKKPYVVNPQGFVMDAYFKPLKNGNWIADGWRQTGIQKYYLLSPELEVLDSFPISNEYVYDFHEVDLLSNGHCLILYIEKVPFDMSEIIEGGDPNAEVLNSIIVETDRNGFVYWTWSALEHLQITDATSDVDLTQPRIDFAHINSYIETPDGNLLISFRHLDEIIKIDKSTGNIIWRFGGEASKNNQFEILNDEVDGFKGFSHQHSVSLLENGNLLIYDNGNLKENQYSRAVEYSINETEKTATKVWEYRYTPDIYVSSEGSAIRLANGNTLINWGIDRVTEVKPDNSIAFEMIFNSQNPSLSGIVYRCYRVVNRMNAILRNINSSGEYNFNDEKNNTGVKLNLNYLEGNGPVSVEKHDYPVPEPQFADSTFTEILPFRWVISRTGIDSIAGTFKLNAAVFDSQLPHEKIRIYKRDKETTGTFRYISTYYNSGTGELVAQLDGFGELVACLDNLNIPEVLQPAPGSKDIPVNGIVRWDTIPKAVKYRIQLAADIAFGNIILDSVVHNTFSDYKNLKYNSVYYVRIKAFNPGDSSEWSAVSDFRTVKPIAPKLLLPPNRFVGADTLTELSWEKAPGADKYQLQVSAKPDFVAFITDTILSAKLSKIQGLTLNTRYYWRVRCFQNENSSDWSDVFDFTTTLPAPALSYPPNDTINQPETGTLFWNIVSGALTYIIEISGAPDFKSVIAYKKNIGNRQFQYEKLEAYGYYYWRVKACRSYDTSKWSESFRFRIKPSSPVLLSPPAGAVKQQLQLKLDWNASQNAIGYSLQISTDSKFTNIIVDTSNLAQLYFITGKLNSLKQYFWRVASIFSDTISPWSESWSFTTGEKSQPVVPKLLSPIGNTLQFIEGTLKWQDSENFQIYNVQVSKEKDFKTVLIDMLVVDTNFCFFDNLDYNSLFYWRVRSVVDGDSSAWSDTGIFTTLRESTKLLYPKNELSQVPVEGKFEWETLNGVSHYNIQVSDNQAFGNLITDSTLENSGNLDFKLVRNKSYYWRVRYIFDGKQGNWSNVNWFITETDSPLNTPQLTKPDNGSTGIHVNGSLSWAPVADAKNYRIAIAKDSNFEDIVLSYSDVADVKLIYSGLENNSWYYWRVTAFNDNNSSRWSEIRNFLTELKQPVNLYPADGSEKIPVNGAIKWNSVDGADFYRIQVSLSNDFIETVIDTHVYSDTSLSYKLSWSAKYFWRVLAQSSNNTSPWGEPAWFATELQDSGVKTNENIYLLFPNPAYDYIEIKSERDSLTGYRIFSTEGFLLLKGPLETKKINVKPLPPGCYIIEINNKYQIFIKL